LRQPNEATYLKEVLIEVNLLLSLVPRLFTTAIMAREMPAAINPYSMAVATNSSARIADDKKLFQNRRLGNHSDSLEQRS
jgi:hypothetical protein